MKKILPIFGVTSLFFGVMSSINLPRDIVNNQNENNYLLNTDYSRANVTNLSRIRVNEFNTDLSVFENKQITRDDYLEEIKWSMIDSNTEIEDLMFDIWDSVIYDEPEKWQISGLDWILPEKGNEVSVRVRMTPESIPFYSGSLSFKTTLVNESKTVTDISNIIKNTFIGTVLDNNQGTIKDRIEQKNGESLITWNQLRFSNLTETSVSIIALENSTVYKGAVAVDFKIGQNLNLVVKNANIGKIEENVNERIILNKLKNLNSELLIDQLMVKNIDVQSGTALLVPINDTSDYVGERVISFVDSTHLSEVVTSTNLGSFINPRKTDLEDKIISLNKTVKRTDFTIVASSLSYRGCTIKATANSIFHGEVKITFYGTVETNISYDSGIKSVSAYAETKTDSVTDTLSIQPFLGKDAFLRTYKTINFGTILYAWMNHTPSSGSELNNKIKSFNNSLSAVNVANDFYKVKYVYVNWMTCHSTYKYYWSGDSLKIEVWTKAQAFASGWNVKWAKAKSQTKISSIWFN